ncbi:MAG: hypothetical protein HYU57_02660 [Micavibrio aeruginosavorus]|nr:hypothetical protein [Micavibrio aeruginosavorus]
MMAATSLLKQIGNYVRQFIRGQGGSDARPRHAGSSYGDKNGARRKLTPEKQAALENLTQKLLQKQDLILSGKLQLIGLEKVRQRLGKRWDGFKPVIYKICEDAICRYINPGDFYLRYRNESYIILFAEQDPAVNDLRVALIAAEIRKNIALEDELAGLEITGAIVPVRAGGEDGLTVLDNRPDNAPQLYAPVPQAQPPQTLQDQIASARKTLIDPEPAPGIRQPRAALDLGIDLSAAAFSAVCYLPVWDHYKGRLTAHLCLAANRDGSGSSILSHKALYNGQGAARRGLFDLAILASVIGWLHSHPDDTGKFGIICPVHYDSLFNVETKVKYRTMYQKITDSMKERILFMVLDVPPYAPWASLSQFAAPLKNYGRVLCAQLPLSANADFDTLRRAGFDNIGFLLEPPSRNGAQDSEIRIPGEARQFIAKAKKHLIRQTFALGVNDPMTAAILAKAGVRYISGDAVYQAMPHPSEDIDFYKNDMFRVWQALRHTRQPTARQ